MFLTHTYIHILTHTYIHTLTHTSTHTRAYNMNKNKSEQGYTLDEICNQRVSENRVKISII